MADIFYMSNKEQEKYFLNKINNKEVLTEKELSILRNNFIVCEEEGEDHRWQKDVKTIVMLKDKFFAIEWMRGLTELQDNSWYEQPYEVTPYEKQVTITLKEWRKKND